MALFRYRALDATGQAADGVMEEDSARRVIAALQQRGLTVNLVERAEPKRAIFSRKPKLTWDDLHQFNEHLLTATRCNAGLIPAMEAMEHELNRPQVRSVLKDVRRHVEAGNSLSDAFARHPESFSPVYTALVSAGERTGSLSAVFSCLATYSKRAVELRNSIQEALAYPVILILVAGAVLLMMLLKIVPIYRDVFEGFGGRLPVQTQLVLMLSELLRQHGGLVAIICVFALFVAYSALRRVVKGESHGYALDNTKMAVPLFGKIYKLVSTERFCRALGLLLNKGVAPKEALDLAAASAGNSVMSRRIASAAHQVSSGTSIADALRTTRLFKNSFCWLLSNAEKRGELDTALPILADGIARNILILQRRVKLISEPVLIVLLGLVVGFVIKALYMPMFSLGDVINK